MKNNVVIVGGGIAGLCSALYLLQKGYSVSVIDKGDFKDNCSYGNAGMIVPSHFTPLAAPGIIAKGLRWMLDKKSPFYIRPTLNPSVIKWGMRFWKHATEKHVKTSAPFIRDINELGMQEYIHLKKDGVLDFELETKGILMLYKNKKTEEEEIMLASRATELGLACDVLDKSAISKLEPELDMNVIGGVHYRSDGHINPAEFMQRLLAGLKQLGCSFYPDNKVKDIEVKGGMVYKLLTESSEFKADQFVFATGADLGLTMKSMGIYLPMLGGKGYSFMTNKFGGKLRLPSLLIDDRVSVTPMGDMVRIGGTMELATNSNDINLHKVKGISDAVGLYYPDVKMEVPEKSSVWHGFRPCTPDGLPCLGRLKSFSNVIVAGGGGMMGVSCGPAFGKIVSELIDESTLSMDIRHFDPERFN